MFSGAKQVNSGLMMAVQIKTFEQWQALGYDLHSVVINPEFINFTDFVPPMRLDYGKNLGSDLQKD